MWGGGGEKALGDKAPDGGGYFSWQPMKVYLVDCSFINMDLT